MRGPQTANSFSTLTFCLEDYFYIGFNISSFPVSTSISQKIGFWNINIDKYCLLKCVARIKKHRSRQKRTGKHSSRLSTSTLMLSLCSREMKPTSGGITPKLDAVWPLIPGLRRQRQVPGQTGLQSETLSRKRKQNRVILWGFFGPAKNYLGSLSHFRLL